MDLIDDVDTRDRLDLGELGEADARDGFSLDGRRDETPRLPFAVVSIELLGGRRDEKRLDVLQVRDFGIERLHLIAHVVERIALVGVLGTAFAERLLLDRFHLLGKRLALLLERCDLFANLLHGNLALLGPNFRCDDP